MELVWRVENADGVGPYLCLIGIVRKVAMSNFSNDTQPEPEWDFDQQAIQTSGRSWLYGFQSFEAAVNWFGVEALEQFAAYGFFLRQVRAVDVEVSNSGKQLVFKRSYNGNQSAI